MLSAMVSTSSYREGAEGIWHSATRVRIREDLPRIVAGAYLNAPCGLLMDSAHVIHGRRKVRVGIGGVSRRAGRGKNRPSGGSRKACLFFRKKAWKNAAGMAFSDGRWTGKEA